MATIATSADGSGTSKVYVAQDHDLEIAILPAALDNRAQFIRVLPWRWVAKKGASDLSADVLDAAWRYNWNNNLESTLDWEYVPIKQQAYWPALPTTKQNVTHLLGFNEPDQHDQSNLSVERVLDVWPVLMRTGLRLGSPGCVHPDRDWMKAFMKGVEERKLRVDFICMHSYGGPDPDGLVGRVRSVSRMFGNRPVWITEYAVGDWNAKSPDQNRYKPAQVADFMRKVFPKLDELECLERHAWFPSAPSSAPLGTSALTKADGSLTELGQLYASL
jgi:hypothetical protein